MYFFDCYSPPPYRPNSSISLVDLPGPKLRKARPVVKSASREDGELRSLEEKIIPSHAADTNQAYVIGLHVVTIFIYSFNKISYLSLTVFNSLNH